jgi:hypothetical protein
MQTFKLSVSLPDDTHPDMELRLSADDSDCAVVIALPLTPRPPAVVSQPKNNESPAGDQDEYVLGRNLTSWRVGIDTPLPTRKGRSTPDRFAGTHMVSKKVLSLALLLAMAPAAEAMASTGDVVSTTDVAAAADLGQVAPSAPAAGSGDCSQGFFSRLGAAYREDAQPADPNAAAPARRAMDAPLDAPPFPNGEWQLGGVAAPIGVPNSYGQYPLQKALSCTKLGNRRPT